MADFPARLAELEAALNETLPADLAAAGESGGDQALTTSCYTIASSGLKAYAEWRDKALTEALDDLAETDDDTAQERQAAWQEQLNRFGAEALKKVIDVAKSIQELETRASRLRALLDLTAQQEQIFFTRLAGMPLGHLKGTLQTNESEFRREAKSLLDKWEDLGDRDRPVRDKANDTLAKVRELFRETTDELIAADRDLSEKLRNVSIDPGKPMTGSTLETIGNLLKGAVQLTVGELETYRRSGQQYVDDLARVFAGHELIVIMFTQIRTAVREFLSRTNLKTTLAEVQTTRSQALELAAGCPTDGQQEDAADFVELALETLEDGVSRFEDAYGDFVSEHRGIFVGAAELTRLDDLLDLVDLVDTWKDAERVNIESALKQLLDHTVAWEIDVEGLSDEAAKDLKDALKSIGEPLSKGLVAASNDRLVDQFATMVTDRVGRLRELVKNSKGGEE